MKNIIVCENWKDAAETFKKPLMEALNEENSKIFEEYVGISEAVPVSYTHLYRMHGF